MYICVFIYTINAPALEALGRDYDDAPGHDYRRRVPPPVMRLSVQSLPTATSRRGKLLPYYVKGRRRDERVQCCRRRSALRGNR